MPSCHHSRKSQHPEVKQPFNHDTTAIACSSVHLIRIRTGVFLPTTYDDICSIGIIHEMSISRLHGPKTQILHYTCLKMKDSEELCLRT